MKITIWSDFVCPFCYIGTTNLKNALEKFEHSDEVDIEYKSYELDPNAAHVPGETYVETLAAKKGVSAAEMRTSFSQVEKMAKEAGLDFNFDIVKEANTMDAHRIFQYAAGEGKGIDFYNRLYKAVFEDGLVVSDHDTLIDLSTEVGLDEGAVRSILDNPAINRDQVRQDVAVANQIGVQGVPFFVFNDKYGVPGAQPVDVFEKALNQIYDETHA